MSQSREPEDQPGVAKTKKWNPVSYAMHCLFGIVLALSFPFPQPVETGLDGSWRVALSLLHPTDFANTPIVFTYGIFGFLIRGAATSDSFTPIILFRIAVYVIYAAILLRYYAKLTGGFNRLIVIVVFGLPALLSLAKPYYQTEYQIAILTPLILLAPGLSSLGWRHIGALSLWSGFLFHTKASLFYHSFLPIILYIIARGCLEERFRISSGIARISKDGSIALAFCAAGIILPYYLSTRSILPHFNLIKEITSGYSEGMGAGQWNLQHYIAIVVLLIWVLSLVFVLMGRGWAANKTVLISLAPLTFIVILAFKHAFVRQGHYPRFFVISLTMYGILLTCEELANGDRMTITRKALLSGIMATSAIAYFASLALTGITKSLAQDFASHLQSMSNPLAIKSILARQTETNTTRVKLPKDIRTRIDDQSVDIVPRELSMAYANQLRWQPRPTLQSYQGYTEQLDRLNARHMIHSGPRFLLIHQDSLDAKNQAFYSPSEWAEIVCRYQAVASFDSPYMGLVTLAERLGQSRCKEWEKLHEINGSINQIIHLGKAKQRGMLSLSISVKPNLLGRLQATMLRGPVVGIKLHYPGRRTTNLIRFAPTNARNGLLVYPLATSGSDLYCMSRSPLQCDRTPPEAITISTQHPELFDSNVTVTAWIASLNEKAQLP